jgi:hypothetical protein
MVEEKIKRAGAGRAINLTKMAVVASVQMANISFRDESAAPRISDVHQDGFNECQRTQLTSLGHPLPASRFVVTVSSP